MGVPATPQHPHPLWSKCVWVQFASTKPHIWRIYACQFHCVLLSVTFLQQHFFYVNLEAEKEKNVYMHIGAVNKSLGITKMFCSPWARKESKRGIFPREDMTLSNERKKLWKLKNMKEKMPGHGFDCQKSRKFLKEWKTLMAAKLKLLDNRKFPRNDNSSKNFY